MGTSEFKYYLKILNDHEIYPDDSFEALAQLFYFYIEFGSFDTFENFLNQFITVYYYFKSN